MVTERLAGLSARERLVLALDLEDMVQAREALVELKNEIGMVKIGLQFCSALGLPRAIEFVSVLCPGRGIVVDLKLHDVPKTMARATAAIVRYPQVKLFTMHASANVEGMQGVVKRSGATAKALGVTVLTSMTEAQCRRIYGKSPPDKVREMVEDMLEAQVPGLVCSPQELEMLDRDEKFDGLIRMVPGATPAWAPAKEQARPLPPREAMRLGADLLVFGSAILEVPEGIESRVAAARLIVQEIQLGLEDRAREVRS